MNAIVKSEAMDNAMQLESINNQIEVLLNGDKRSMQSFKSRMLTISMNSSLAKCTTESLVNIGLQALTLGLTLEGGQGYVVAYKSKAQLDVGYKGWQMLAKRVGWSVLADAVYACDHFVEEGFAFDAVYDFKPNRAERSAADDKWVKENIIGVLVSVREDDSGLKTSHFVESDLLFKIIGMSPSGTSEHSPHNKWAAQMMCAKAIKYVVSKMPVDLLKSSHINDAIEIVNETEKLAQSQVPTGPKEYSQESFDANWDSWVDLVKNGKQSSRIITQLTNGFKMTQEQVKKLMTLSDYEVLDGELVAEDEPKSVYSWSGDTEVFKEHYAEWRRMVEDGEITVAELLQMINTHNEKVSAKQLKDIEGLRDCQPVVAEAS